MINCSLTFVEWHLLFNYICQQFQSLMGNGILWSFVTLCWSQCIVTFVGALWIKLFNINKWNMSLYVFSWNMSVADLTLIKVLSNMFCYSRRQYWFLELVSLLFPGKLILKFHWATRTKRLRTEQQMTFHNFTLLQTSHNVPTWSKYYYYYY